MSARPPTGGSLFDDLMRELLGRVEEMIDARLPTMGEVKGRDGGKVRVRLDDEDEDRVIGFPRSLGVAYENGDRVPIVYSRGGAPMVLGVVGGGNGDGRVRNEQLDKDSVDTRVLRGNIIDHGQLTGSLSNEIKGALRNSDVKGSIGDKNKIITESALDPYAKTQALNSKAEQREVDDLKQRVADLEKKIKRADKGDRKKKK